MGGIPPSCPCSFSFLNPHPSLPPSFTPSSCEILALSPSWDWSQGFVCTLNTLAHPHILFIHWLPPHFPQPQFSHSTISSSSINSSLFSSVAAVLFFPPLSRGMCVCGLFTQWDHRGFRLNALYSGTITQAGPFAPFFLFGWHQCAACQEWFQYQLRGQMTDGCSCGLDRAGSLLASLDSHHLNLNGHSVNNCLVERFIEKIL